MTLYAHRGWSMGTGDGWIENTVSAFKVSEANEIKAVEIDIRMHPVTQEVVLSHDPIITDQNYTTLEDALNYINNAKWNVIIEFKEYSQELFKEVVSLITKYNLQSKVVLFGFSNIATHFPWHNTRDVQLGIIVEYPWSIREIVRKYKPNVILLGWDDRKWTQIAFKTWWSMASLNKMAKKYDIEVISGVAESKAQIKWLNTQNIRGYTCDMRNV